MAFGFGNPGAMGGGGLGPNIQSGPDLEDIQTDALGFLALSGEARVQLLSSPWPADSLPPPTASLMSVASQKGLVAAAGPDAIILATTESIRQAFEVPSSGDGNFKSFQPQMRLPMPMRISQIAFSADESYLVLAAEVGGGLAVYEVQALLRGSTDTSFQLSTNGQALRALVPNPTPEKGELFAVVTADGNLMMANLKKKAFITTSNTQILKDGVSCISWSAKGKQLVAGLGNGTAYQMTPDGEPKGDIPRPPGMDSNHHISSITWIENNVFLMVYTPTSFDPGTVPFSIFNIVTRQSPSSFQFQKISEPVAPYLLDRSPPHHFLLRLRDWGDLQDLLIVASTASTDIGLFSRSKSPLASNKPVGVFTMTELLDDFRRAQLPMSAESNDTSPIGFALDLSSKEKVGKPIPRDEIDESPTPLPALMVLNNDGVLASWWIVYTDAVRQGTIYPNLVAAGPSPQTIQPSSPTPARPPTSTSTFGGTFKPSFGGPPNSVSTMGGAFGSTSNIGQRQSPWGTPAATLPAANNTSSFAKPVFGAAATPSTFGTPSFGTTSTPAFGTSGFSGNKTSPWGTSNTSTPAFGQATNFGKHASAFGSTPPSTGPSAPSSGGFGKFASQNGFAGAGVASTGSVFGTKQTSSVFGGSNSKSGTTTTLFGSTATKASQNLGGSLGGVTNNFVLGSTFKPDGTAKNDAPAPSSDNKSSFFGSNFGSALGEAGSTSLPEPPVSKDADMDTTEDLSSTTPVSTPASTQTLFRPSDTAGSTGQFGTTGLNTFSSVAKPTTSSGFLFGSSTQQENKANFSFAKLGATVEKTSTSSNQTPVVSKAPASPVVKEEVSSETEVGSTTSAIPDAPLPPEPTSKSSYTAGDTSVSSTGTDASLSADVVSKPTPKPTQVTPPLPTKSIYADLVPPSDVPGGPEDEDNSSDFLTEEEGGDEGADLDGNSEEDEGSGEDITQDISPTSEVNQTPGVTPQGSFGVQNRGTDSTLFTKIEKPIPPTQQRSLFGEIDRLAPVLPPPNLPPSPRSPSPIRNGVPRRLQQRPETFRSSSAPGAASKILESQKQNSQSQNTFTLSLEQHNADERQRAQARARREAAETQALIDNYDDQLQEIISSDLEPTRTLDEFVAHVEVKGPSSVESIPAQVETVYRDINSMIDTLGLNARALKSFIKGHTEQYKDGGRGKEDLEDEEDWCLVEVEDLSMVIDRVLARELQDGRIKDVASKLETCNDLQKDLIRLHAKHDDIKKIMAAHSDPGHIALTRSQPLTAEQAAQQHDVRRDFTKFQKLLSEAEEGLTILKAKIVSQTTSNGKSTATAGPTVEAIMRTITKMTSMAEKRSGDIDVLEGQMRKLRLKSGATIGSREGSPFTTPNQRASMRNPGTSSTYGLFYTPDSINDDRRGFQNSLMSSTSSLALGSPPRKKMSGYSAEEKTQLRTRVSERKEQINRLRDALQKAGAKVRLMDHDE